MNEVVRHALFEIVVPLPLAAAFAFVGRLLLSRNRERPASLLFAGAAVVPMPIAFALSNGMPTESWEGLIWLTLVGGAVGAACLFTRNSIRRDLVAALLLAAALTAVLWPIVRPESQWSVRLAPGLAAAALYLVHRLLATRLTPVQLLLALWASAVGTGLAVVLMGQMSMGAAVAPIGASTLVLAFFARGERTQPVSPAVLAPVACALAVTPAVAWMWAKETGAGYGLWLPLLVPLSVLAGLVGTLKPLRTRGPRLRNTLSTVAVLVVALGLVGAMNALAGAADDDDYGDLPDFMKLPMD